MNATALEDYQHLVLDGWKRFAKKTNSVQLYASTIIGAYMALIQMAEGVLQPVPCFHGHEPELILRGNDTNQWQGSMVCEDCDFSVDGGQRGRSKADAWVDGQEAWNRFFLEDPKKLIDWAFAHAEKCLTQTAK